jgi:FkbM family methyltransferase
MTIGSTTGSAEELNARGNELAAERRYAEAEATYRRALELDPSLAKVYGNLATVLAHQGNLHDAESALRRGLELGGTPKLATKLASLLIDLGRAGEVPPIAAKSRAEVAVAMVRPLAAHFESAGSVLRAGAAWLAIEALAPEEVAREVGRLSLEVELAAGGAVVVPNALDLITPFVLLEQRDWFEDEIHFVRRVLRAGEGAVDVGANFGVYTLAMARAVGASGRVVAYEPASATFAYLMETLRRNGLHQVGAVRAALSREPGEAVFSNAASPELSGLTATGAAPRTWRETVRLETLDSATSRLAGHSVSLVKLDAEGEEVRILEGGARFLAEHDPLIMTELRHDGVDNTALLAKLEQMGLSLYRLVPGPNALEPLREPAMREPFLLNVFACSPQRARSLKARGLLGDAADGQAPGPLAHAEAHERLVVRGGGGSPRYLEAAALYSATALALTLDDRLAGLEAAYRAAVELTSAEASAAALCLLTRVAGDLGRRAEANASASRALKAAREGALGAPLVAPGAFADAAFSAPPPRRDVEAALLEHLLRRGHYSLYYDRQAVGLARELVEIGDPRGYGARVVDVVRRATR